MKANDIITRTKYINFRVAEHEYAAIKRAAREDKKTVSNWLREGIQNTLIPQAIAKQAMKSIKKA